MDSNIFLEKCHWYFSWVRYIISLEQMYVRGAASLKDGEPTLLYTNWWCRRRGSGPWQYKHQDHRVCLCEVQPWFSAPRCGGPKYMKGSAVIFLSRFVVQVNLLHCTIISVKSLKRLVGAAWFEHATPSPPAMTSLRKLLETTEL